MTREPQGHEYWFTGGILEDEPVDIDRECTVMLWNAFPVNVYPGDRLRLLRTGSGLQIGGVESGVVT